MHRPAEIRREVTVPDAFISSESLGAREWKLDRTIAIPSWPGLDDRTYLYRRDASAPRSS